MSTLRTHKVRGQAFNAIRASHDNVSPPQSYISPPKKGAIDLVLFFDCSFSIGFSPLWLINMVRAFVELDFGA